MKTKLCRPVLIESEDISSNIWGIFGLLESLEKGITLTLVNNEVAKINLHKSLDIYKEKLIEANWKPYQLILINLDPDEKIEENDSWIGHKIGEIEEESKLTLVTPKNRKSILHHVVKSKFGKIIATQDQLSPKYIQQFIEEYNKGKVKDVEIEMFEPTLYTEDGLDYKDNIQPKLTNGFVTIVEKELDRGIIIKNINDSILYTEEEVENLTYNAMKEIGYTPVIKHRTWFEQNKKK